MSHLHAKPTHTNDDGCIQCITPESAGWEYVGFEVFKLEAGQSLNQLTESKEVCIVLMAGKASIKTSQYEWKDLGLRKSPFDEIPPYAVYLPPNDEFTIDAVTEVEIALCKAPALGKFPTRLITPDDCALEIRGEGSNQRKVCNILFGNMDAEKLLVVEVITPNGNWSSYPPHKHDSQTPDKETLLEETYYHRLNPPQGFAFQRVYTDDRSLDETITVEDSSVVMVPEGYHPVGAAHGYDLYYLNVMAGPERKWIFRNDPEHEWIVNETK